LNEEKLCQLLANQTRALQRVLRQGVSHVHHLQIRQPQKLAIQRVLETDAQVQTLSHVKTVEAGVLNSEQPQLMLHVSHVQRVPSSKSVQQKLMAQLATAGLQVMIVANLAMSVLHTVAIMLVVQSAKPTIAMIVHLAVTVRLMATAMIVHLEVTVQHMATAITQVVQSVQTMVVVTGLLEATKVQVVQLKRLGVHAMIAIRVLHTATAMIVRLAKTAALVIHVLHMEAAMQIARHALSVTAKIVLRVQVLVVASATATAQSVLHTASQILHASKTALQNAVGQKIAVVTQGVTQVAKKETQTVQTVQLAMILANQLSAVHATQTQTRRLSSRTRFLSV
jgi:hypothetical protein